MQLTTIYLKVARFNIKIYFKKTSFSNADYAQKELWQKIKVNYHNFMISYRPKKIDTQVTLCWDKKPESVLNKSTQKRYYSHYKFTHGNFVSYYQNSIFQFQSLLLDILLYLLAQQGGFMLHASALTQKQQVVVFIGPSGAGKSTLINTLKRTYYPIADDTLIIRFRANRYYAYATPFTEKALWLNKNTQPYLIKAICWLYQNQQCQLKSIYVFQAKKYYLTQLVTRQEYKIKHQKSLNQFLTRFKQNYIFKFNQKTKELKQNLKLLFAS
jgi:hypothetical protein